MWISVISTRLGFGFEPSKSFKFLYADVAELADALASGSVTTVDLSACRFPVHISCGAVCEKPTSVLDLSRVRSFKFLYADVAELADALASGASDRKVMWVQVPSSAPRKARFYRAFFFCSSKNKWADTLALRTIFN